MWKTLSMLSLMGSVAVGHKFESCLSAEEQGFSIDNLHVGFDADSSNYLLNVEGTAISSVDDAQMDLRMKFVGVDVGHQVIDLCDNGNNAGNVEFECPLNGHFKGSIAIPSDDFHHMGLNVDLYVKFLDQNRNVLSCSETNLKLHNQNDQFQLKGTSRFEFAKEEIDFLFKQFLKQFGLSFDSVSEYAHREKVFLNNLMSILFHNSGDHTYYKAMNQFGHLTGEEFKQMTTGFNYAEKKLLPKVQADEIVIPPESYTLRRVLDDPLPESIDWVTKNAVTPVKNQGSCGSCWSFSTTGAMEGAYAVKTNTLKSFSEQELVGCDKVDQGCNGGLMDNAFAWIQQNKGICLEADYPYTSGAGVRGFCKKKCTVVPGTTPQSIVDVDHTEVALRTAVSKVPVAIAIEADQTAFQFYSKGVLTGTCSNQLDHGVLLVGYGAMNVTSTAGKVTEEKFWKVKNSWGGTWGQEGYILLERAKKVEGGQCGILLSASYVTL